MAGISSSLDKFGKYEKQVAGWDLQSSINNVNDLLTDIETLQSASKGLFVMDIQLIMKDRIIYRVWKTTVYKYVWLIREHLKKHPEDKPRFSNFLQILIDKAQLYFGHLMTILESRCSISHDNITGKGIFIWKDNSSESCYSTCAKDCYVQILILMGDVYRYSYLNPLKLRQALERYELARALAPSKGRVYHQIGVIAQQRGDWVSTVYNLTRAYIAPEPEEEVRQELLIVYDDVYKEVESSYWFAKAKTNERFPNVYLRRERWVFTIGHEKIPPVFDDPHNKETHFQNLNDFEIYNRFAITYVQFIGKLFTHIGLDFLNVVAEEALIYFEELLKRANIKLLHPLRVIQIMALNIFIVDFIKEKVSKEPNAEYLLVSVVNFVMEMFSLLCEKLSNLIYVCDWDNPIMESLSTGLQVWCNWMELNRRVWSHRRPRAVFSVRRAITTKYDNKREREDEVWIQFANLMSRLEVVVLRFQNTLFPFVSEQMDSVCCVPIGPFVECINLASFPNFTGANINNRQYFADNTRTKMRARICVRLNNIYSFGCNMIVKPGKILQPVDSFYNCLVYKNMVRTSKIKADSEICGVDNKSYHFYTDFNNPPILPPKKDRRRPLIRKPDCNNSRVIVRARKTVSTEIILPTWKGMQKYEEWLYCSNRNYLMQILVEPLRLVIDTNCFINKFPLIEILLKIIITPLFIPVSVIHELRGLSRGGFTVKDRARFGTPENPAAKEKLIKNKEVAEKCKIALGFIQRKKDYFLVVTSTGALISIDKSWYQMKDNYYDPSRSNDDRIIDTCRYLESRDVESRAKDCQRRIYRKTVLITGDRNLRIRASSMDIPSRPVASIILWFNFSLQPEALTEFMKWARKRDWERRQLYRNRRKRENT